MNIRKYPFNFIIQIHFLYKGVLFSILYLIICFRSMKQFGSHFMNIIYSFAVYLELTLRAWHPSGQYDKPNTLCASFCCQPLPTMIAGGIIYIIFLCLHNDDIDGLVQVRNSSTVAIELRLSCIHPSIWFGDILSGILVFGDTICATWMRIKVIRIWWFVITDNFILCDSGSLSWI